MWVSMSLKEAFARLARSGRTRVDFFKWVGPLSYIGAAANGER